MKFQANVQRETVRPDHLRLAASCLLLALCGSVDHYGKGNSGYLVIAAFLRQELDVIECISDIAIGRLRDEVDSFYRRSFDFGFPFSIAGKENLVQDSIHGLFQDGDRNGIVPRF